MTKAGKKKLNLHSYPLKTGEHTSVRLPFNLTSGLWLGLGEGLGNQGNYWFSGFQRTVLPPCLWSGPDSVDIVEQLQVS